MSQNLKSLLESLLDEETVKLEFPWKQWTLNKKNGVLFMNAYRNKANPINKFYYEPNGVVPKEISEDDGAGIWNPTSAASDGTPFFKSSIITLDYDNERFIIKTSLNDPRIAYVVKSTVETLPETSNFKISKVKDNDEKPINAPAEFNDFGLASEMVSKIKTSKGTFSAYSKDEERFEEFEFLVFKELTEETWFHATRASNVKSIMQKGLLTSKNFNQDAGWTAFNFDLQNAVYLTKDYSYAEEIAVTLTMRFNEDAAILAIDGKALQDFSKITSDEDILRDQLEGNVQAYGDEDFTSFKNRMPEVIESAVHNISSIGYKDTIKPEYITVEEIVQVDVEEKEESDVNDKPLKENVKNRNTNNFLGILNYKKINKK